MPFRAPVADQSFILTHVAPLAPVSATDRFAEATPDLAQEILASAGRLADEVLAPLNRAGDKTPARLENGVVRTSPGFAEGYRAIAEGGWVGMAAAPELGGMGLPMALTAAVGESFAGANLALQLNPLLTQGQIEAMEHHASDEIKALYVPKLASGDWTGTMNLTEPQAGSDVGALTSRAEPAGDGTFRITGQKIWISGGEQDFTDNIVHLVLARIEGAPAGVKGISLFVVPKFIPDADGAPCQCNGVSCVGL